MNININDVVDNYKSDIINLASELIKIPSENAAPNGNEKEAQDYLEKWFKSNHISTDKFNLLDVKDIEKNEAYWPGRNYENRPNLVAFIKGNGKGKSIIFSSHIDTVSRDPIPWNISTPFSGTIIGDKLYGRGAYDMKASLAATALVLKILKDLKIELSGDVYFESVVDEENAGANGTLASRLKGYNADVAIVPEPTMMNICPSTKGGQLFEILFKGLPGVCFGGEEIINPIYNMARIISSFEEKYVKAINDIKELPELFEDEKNLRRIVISKVKAGDLKLGGNIGVPSEAWFEIFIQVLPGYNEEMLHDEIQNFINLSIAENNINQEFSPIIKKTSRFLYPAVSDSNHPILKIIKHQFKEITGKDGNVKGGDISGDMGIFTKYFNIPTVTFGPCGGNAHGKDEWVSINSLIDFTKIILATTLEWCK